MPETAPEVTAIVVSWNQRALLADALESLSESQSVALRLIVVDNGSTDGSAALVAERFPGAGLITLPANVGFAAANNRGFAAGRAAGAKFVFLLNNDATVAADCLAELKALMDANPRCTAACPYIMYHDQRDIIWYGGGVAATAVGYIAHRRIRTRYAPEDLNAERTRYLSGCAALIRTEALAAAGGFDERFGMYSEDVDLGLRLIEAGGEVWVTPKARAYHRVSASALGALSPLKSYYRARSNALLFRRWTKLWQWPALAVGSALTFVYVAARLMLRGRFKAVAAAANGAAAGLFGLRPPAKYRLFQ